MDQVVPPAAVDGHNGLRGQESREGGRPLSRPRSCVNQWVVGAGLAAFLIAVACLRQWPPSHPAVAVIVVVLLTAGAILAAEHAVGAHPMLAGTFARATDWGRVGVKLLGLAATFAALGLAYWLFPIYRQDQAQVIWTLVSVLGLPMLLLSPIYVALVDARMGEPVDGLHAVGSVVLGRWRQIDREALKNYILGWIVKGFFLPLMATYSVKDMEWLLSLRLGDVLSGPAVGMYDTSYRLLFFIDVTWAVMGYMLTLKLFDTHIRSTDPTAMGWIVCLMCYQPFWGMVQASYINYEDGVYWGAWLSPFPMLKITWGVLILALLVVYVWATLSFGARFSNLTNRGIVTNGPYAWTKHPAYLSKNIAFWLISLPMLNASPLEGARQCLLLLLLNSVYLARAATEERHLMRDPIYREYVLWMHEHGPLARVRRAVGARMRRSPMIPRS